MKPIFIRMLVFRCLELKLKIKSLVFVKRRELERLAGFFNFAAQFLRLGRLFLKPIVCWMNRNTSVALRDRYVLLNDSLMEALNPWMDPDQRYQGTDIPANA